MKSGADIDSSNSVFSYKVANLKQYLNVLLLSLLQELMIVTTSFVSKLLKTEFIIKCF